jgi:hypothetical protein
MFDALARLAHVHRRAVLIASILVFAGAGALGAGVATRRSHR